MYTKMRCKTPTNATVFIYILLSCFRIIYFLCRWILFFSLDFYPHTKFMLTRIHSPTQWTALFINTPTQKYRNIFFYRFRLAPTQCIMLHESKKNCSRFIVICVAYSRLKREKEKKRRTVTVVDTKMKCCEHPHSVSLQVVCVFAAQKIYSVRMQYQVQSAMNLNCENLLILIQSWIYIALKSRASMI